MKERKMPLTDRLSEFAQNARDEAEKLEPGSERQVLLEKARNAEAASELEAWHGLTLACVYQKLKHGRSGDEVRPGWRVN